MGASVQVNGGKYERTTDPKRMMVHSVLTEAIRRDLEGIIFFLPCRVATYIEYKSGATEAMAWNEGERPTKIYLPLEGGWYVPGANPFAIPNGKPSNSRDLEALHLTRNPDGEYSGPLGRGISWGGDHLGRSVNADGNWSSYPGVALVGNGAAAPLVEVPGEKLVAVADPQTLRQDAHELREIAGCLLIRFGDDKTSYATIIGPLMAKAARFIELADAIDGIRK